MWKCKHCNLNFDFESTSQKANHTRWCEKNPKIEEFRATAKLAARHASNASRGRVVSEETRIKLRNASLGKPNGFAGKLHSPESRKKISIAARNSKHRRLLRSTQEYTKTDGSKVLLDSSWEVALAVRLDELSIQWSRPAIPLTWVDNQGNCRNYFPDFYLEKYNIYLDPKNKEAFKKQKEKVDWLLINRPDVIFLHTLEECKNYLPAVV